MSTLHDAMTALLSGITTYKAGTKEIQWKNNHGVDITIEVIDTNTESYVERYYDNGQPSYEYNYQNGQLHGLSTEWYSNEQLRYEYNYQNGLEHGASKGWYNNGQLNYEDNYQNGILHGASKEWYDNGQLNYEYNYQDGVKQ